jgi:hypothetical protein
VDGRADERDVERGAERGAERVAERVAGHSAGDAQGARPDAPVVVLQPKLAARVGAPASVLMLIMVAFTATPAFLVLLLAAVPLTIASFGRIEVTEQTIRRRTWLGWQPVIRLDDIVGVRMRRAKVAGIEALRRGYGVGRSSTMPLVLRLASAEGSVFSITVMWWDGWRELARYVGCLPQVRVGSRTRHRLTHYGGVRVPSSP